MSRLWVIVVAMLWASPLWAVIESYEFHDEATQKRYQQFIDELRCPKCQNQNLAGSNAPIAADLRHELVRLLEDGRSDKEIVDFMVGRYGDFVLYRPRFNAETAVLWLAPAGFLLAGFMAILLIYRRQKQPALVQADNSALSAEEQQRLQTLLNQDPNHVSPDRDQPHV